MRQSITSWKTRWKRFSIGYVSTSADDAVEQLVGVVTPLCSSANFGSLEQAILDYYPEWERRAGNRRWRGVSQLRLLSNLEPSRLSEMGVRRLQALRRKFEDAGPLERRGVEGGRVNSPIPESSARKMNDDEWLGAIERYSSDSPSHEPEKFLVGGAHQLSQLLEAQTHEDPHRFANLVHRHSRRLQFLLFWRNPPRPSGGGHRSGDRSEGVSALSQNSRAPSRPLGDKTACSFCRLSIAR